MLSRAVPFLARAFSAKRVKVPDLNSKITIPDTNSHLTREVLFRTKTKDRRDVTYELTLPQDHALVVKFLKTYFIKNEPLGATLKLDDFDMNEFIKLMETMTTFFIMAKVDGNVVGVTCFMLEDHQEQAPKPVWTPDFGKLNDAGPSKSRKINTMMNYVFECEKIVYHTVPAPSLLANAALLAVHPDFRRQGIGFILDIGAYKIAYQRNAEYVINGQSSVASNNMIMNLPGQTLLGKFEHASCIDYGKRPFENVVDGGKYMGVYLLDLKKYWPQYEKILTKAVQKYS